MAEGSSATMSFPVTLSAALTNDVVLTYRITHGTTGAADTTLTAGTDYTYTIPSGTAAGTHQIPLVGIVNDTHVEGDETFTLTLTNATNATLGTATATGTIANDDVRTVSLSPASQSVIENNTTGTMAFTVALSNNTATADVTVGYTVSGSGSFPATPGTDVTPAAGTVTFAPGETSKTISLTIVGDTAGEFDEQFTLTLASPVNATLGAAASATGTIVNDDPLLADLSVSVTDSKDPVVIGENFSYMISVANAGPSTATNVRVQDTLPAGIVYIGYSGAGWTCSFATGVLECTNPSLPAGGASAITVNVAAPGTVGSITNNVIVVSDIVDPQTADNTAATTTQVNANDADVAVTITDTPDPVVTTGTLTYTVAVTNNSAIAASGIQVIDNLPSGVQFVSVSDGASGTKWICSQGQYIVCDYIGNGGVLAAGATTSAITITVTAPAATGDLNNSVSVSSASPDSVPANNTATATTSVISGTSTTTGGRTFSKYLQYNLFGDIKTIGNTIIWANPSKTMTSGCSISGTTPTCRNNEYTMEFVDIDGDASTFNSSSATLNLGDPSYEIVWAGLYWQGDLTNNTGSNNSKIGGSKEAAWPNAGFVKLKTPSSGGYIAITANSLDRIIDTYSGVNWHYSGFADVTAYVKQQGTYTVADIRTTEGKMAYLGGYGGWALQVIYKDPVKGLQFKNVSIFNGFKNIPSGGSEEIPISGFVTPLTGTINSSVSTFVTDGDKESSQPNRTDTLNTGEHLMMYNKKTTTYVDIYDTASPLNNVFNSSIAELGAHFTNKNPNYQDNLGVDIDRFDVSGFVDNNQSSTKFKFTTSGDVYDVDFIAFATDMYTPLIDDLQKSATLNGVTVGPGTTLHPGDTLVYNVKFKNTGGETASQVEVFDDFDLDGLTGIFDVSNFNASAIKLSVKNSTAWQSNPNCGYDSIDHKVWCRIPEVKNNDEYIMQFAVTIRSDYGSDTDRNVTNIAYSKYKNASTGEYVVITSNGYGGESNAHNAGTLPGGMVMPTPNPDECGMFPSVLSAQNNITADKPIECSMATVGTAGSEINVINVVTINAGGSVNQAAASCTVSAPPPPLSLPTFLHSSLLGTTVSVVSDTTFTASDVGNININANNNTVTFTATATPYSDSSTKVMKIGAINDNNRQGMTYIFNEGDYWIESWFMNGNTPEIRMNGKVRFFIANDFRINSNQFSLNTPTSGVASNFYLYGYRDILFDNNGFADAQIAGYLYAARDIVADGNSNFQSFTGALRAGRDIHLQQNQTFTYDNSGADGNAEDCTNPVIYTLTGPYDAWDTFRSVADRNVSTKTVNTAFNLTIASLNSTMTAVETKAAGIKAYYRLLDVDTNTSKSDYQLFDSNASASITSTAFTVASAVRNMKVQFKFCADNNGTGYILKDDTLCGAGPVCTALNTTCYRETMSSDAFALRPHRFYTPINALTDYKAGQNYAFAFYAYDTSDTNVTAYNESESQSTPSFAVDINISDTRPCAQPHLAFTPGISFTDGTSTGTYAVPNVGDFNVTMYEISGQEFALVDADDTADADRYITSFQTTMKVVPDHFVIDGNITNGSGGYTYLSNFEAYNTDLPSREISASMDLNVTAKAVGGLTTTNYSGSCYAKDANLTMSLVNPVSITPSGALSKMIWYEKNHDLNGSIPLSASTTYVLPLGAAQYDNADTNGTAQLRYEINFDRDHRRVVDPFALELGSIDVNDTDAVTGLRTLNSSIEYVYGRIVPRDIRVFGDNVSFSARAAYELYNAPSVASTALPASAFDSGWRVNLIHIDPDDGDANVTRINSTDVNVSSDAANGIETYVFASHALGGYKAHIDTNPWLWYGVNGLNYLDPSGANLDCLTHPCFNIAVVPIIGTTGSAKIDAEDNKASKKSEQGSGWKSTIDYAPALR